MRRVSTSGSGRAGAASCAATMPTAVNAGVRPQSASEEPRAVLVSEILQRRVGARCQVRLGAHGLREQCGVHEEPWLACVRDTQAVQVDDLASAAAPRIEGPGCAELLVRLPHLRLIDHPDPPAGWSVALG